MKCAVSISLGSSKRNHRVEATILGERLILERIGVNGDQAMARRLYAELDGKVDAFGFGGADLSITVNEHVYPLHTVRKLVADVKQTPVVDGAGIRRLVERRLAQYIEAKLPPIAPKRVLVCTAVDRYDLARSFIDAGYTPLFGDFGYALGIPLALRSLASLHAAAALLLPIMGRLPFEWLYPTGKEQESITPKFERWLDWATVIAGDFLYIHRHLPERLDGKIIVTNTTTAEDVELLRSRGAAYLITSTPRIEGRTFGTNLMEAALTAIAGKGRPLTQEELRNMIRGGDLEPTILPLNL